ncbi:MAG: glycosyltransferase [Syntrophobacteraceae bacterium]|jgi:glycosyltransferase involved in cell wall biosynthesis
MNILMLFPYAPLPPPLDLAGTKRNLPFLLELVKYHNVSVLSYGTPEDEKLFSDSYGKFCRKIRFINAKRPRIVNGIERLWLLGTGRSSFRQLFRPSMQLAIDEMTADTRFDLIHCCVQMFGYFRFPTGVPVSSDTHEVTYNLLYRTAKNIRDPFWKALTYLSSRLGKQEEIDLCKKFDLLIATTEADRELFRKDLRDQKIVVIENGAGNSFFEDLGIEPEPFTMVFTGLFTHLPNIHGILYFLDGIFPIILREIPQARVYVVGKSPTRKLLSRASDNVVVTGFVEDVRPYMAMSQVFIIPLLAGGGIRGKALEAMAMKRPIVTTTIGVEGIKLRHNESALFADTPEAFAGAVVRLFRDSALREEIARKAYSTALEHYNWEAQGKELDKTLRSLLPVHQKG